MRHQARDMERGHNHPSACMFVVRLPNHPNWTGCCRILLVHGAMHAFFACTTHHLNVFLTASSRNLHISEVLEAQCAYPISAATVAYDGSRMRRVNVVGAAGGDSDMARTPEDVAGRGIAWIETRASCGVLRPVIVG